MKDVLNKDNVQIGSIVTFKNGGKGKIVWFDKTDILLKSWFISMKIGFIDSQSEDTGQHIFNKNNGRLLTNCAQASMLDILEVTPPKFCWDDLKVGYAFNNNFDGLQYIFMGTIERSVLPFTKDFWCLKLREHLIILLNSFIVRKICSSAFRKEMK